MGDPPPWSQPEHGIVTGLHDREAFKSHGQLGVDSMSPVQSFGGSVGSIERHTSMSETSVSSVVSSSIAEDKGIDYILNSFKDVDFSDALPHIDDDAPNVKWQEFSPPEELFFFSDECAAELKGIIKDSMVGQWQAARLDRERSPSPNESSSMNARRPRKLSIDSPMLATELDPVHSGSSTIAGIPQSPNQMSQRVESKGIEHTQFQPFAGVGVGNVERNNATGTPASPPFQTTGNYPWMGPDSFGTVTTIEAGSRSRTSSITGSLRSRISQSKPHLPHRNFFLSNENTSHNPNFIATANVPAKKASANNGKKKRPKDKIEQCQYCLVELENRYLLGLECDHSYCKRCFPEVIMDIYVEKHIIPPSCCNILVPKKLIQSHLDPTQKAKYKSKEQIAAGAPPVHPLRCQYCQGPVHREGAKCAEEIAKSKTEISSQADDKSEVSSCQVCLSQHCACSSINSRDVMLHIDSPRPSGSPRPSSEALTSDAKPRAIEMDYDDETAARFWNPGALPRSGGRKMDELKSKYAKLELQLNNIHDRQMAAMERRHEDERVHMQEIHVSTKGAAEVQLEELSEASIGKISQQIEELKATHLADIEAMKLKQQEEEDDTFLTITRVYRDKPDKEARIANMLEKMAKLQAEDLEKALQDQKSEVERLESTLQIKEAESKRSLISRGRLQRSQASRQKSMQMKRFWADGEWFNAVIDTRRRMLQEEQTKAVSVLLSTPRLGYF